MPHDCVLKVRGVHSNEWDLGVVFATLQIQEIVEGFGLVVISRSGSNPEQFIYESDQLSALQVSSQSPLMIMLYPVLLV